MDVIYIAGALLAIIFACLGVWLSHKLFGRVSGIPLTVLWNASLILGGICAPLLWRMAVWELTTSDIDESVTLLILLWSIGVIWQLSWCALHIIGLRVWYRKGKQGRLTREMLLVTGKEWRSKPKMRYHNIVSGIIKLVTVLFLWIAGMFAAQSDWWCMGSVLLCVCGMILLLFWSIRLIDALTE